MNGAELLVAALENEGVKQIFGVPGEENLDVVEALRRSSIKLVVTRHEQAAAFMAATHGRLTGEARRLPVDAGPRRAQPDDGRRLCAARRHADGHDHRPEGCPEPQAGALSGRGHRLDDDAADQDGPPDRQPGDDPRHRAGGVPGGAAGAAGPGPSRTAGGHRGRAGARDCAGAAAPDRAAGRPSCGARSRGRDDPRARSGR